MPVFAIDGSWFSLPATPAIRQEFDPDSGLEHEGRGHYPQCLVSTVYDTLRQIPVGRTVSPYGTSEREEALKLMAQIPQKGITIFDRGYTGFEFIKTILDKNLGHFLIRCPAAGTFKTITQFLKSGKQEAIITLRPSKLVIRENKSKNQALEIKSPVTLRVIRMENPQGEISALLTSLQQEEEYPAQEIIELYRRRWEIENFYRDEKVHMSVDTFHSRNSNGIRQELFASLIVSVIARMLMALELETKKQDNPISQEMPGQKIIAAQFKNAVMTIAKEAGVLTSRDPQRAAEIFKEIIQEISRVRYYPSQNPKKSNPRITKRPENKWAKGKSKKIGGKING